MNIIFERKINYYETDKMGVVHHSNYIRFLEEARCYLLENVGLPYNELENKGIMIPVINVNCSYKRHVSFNDVILIKVIIKEFNGVRMNINYDVIDKKTGNTVIVAETKHCFTDNLLKPINIKKHFPEIFDKFNSLKEY